MANTRTKRGGSKSAANGRDELNLAEFPLAAVSTRIPKGRKTLVFEDSICDKSTERDITRRLTISAAEKYGLPTARDDEVILGLVQLSRLDEFTRRDVYFSRYQLIKLLGWRDEGKSYRRLAESLKRWLGVALYYENAWWDKAEQSWVDENFHILDNVTIYDQERRLRRLGLDELPLSSFTWNDVVFRSFRSGYLKQLDMDLYRRLDGAIARRLYRHLDKRFYHGDACEFDLRDLAFDHIGLSRSYDTGGIKRRLNPAIEQLERVNFLRPTPERYVEISRGNWRVRFGRHKQDEVASERVEHPLTRKLVCRGVYPEKAEELVGRYSAERIERQLKTFDWLANRADKRVGRNPPGYLVRAIERDFDPPKDYRELAPSAKSNSTGKTRRNSCANRPQHRLGESAASDDFAQYWNGLSKSQKEQLTQEALTGTAPMLAEGYRRVLKSDNTAATGAYQQIIVRQHLMSLSKANAASGSI